MYQSSLEPPAFARAARAGLEYLRMHVQISYIDCHNLDLISYANLGCLETTLQRSFITKEVIISWTYLFKHITSLHRSTIFSKGSIRAISCNTSTTISS